MVGNGLIARRKELLAKKKKEQNQDELPVFDMVKPNKEEVKEEGVTDDKIDFTEADLTEIKQSDKVINADSLASSPAAVMERDRINSMADSEALCVPLDLIVVEKQWRREDDFVQESINELADSIRDYGQLQPGVVFELEDGRFLLVVGERRYRALMQLKEDDPFKFNVFKANPCRSLETAKFIQLIENVQREDLSPVSEALAIQSLMNEFSLSQTEAAETLGKNKSYVSRRLKLLKHDEETLARLESGEIKPHSQEAQQALQEGDEPATPKPSVIKVSVPQDDLLAVAKLLQRLARKYGLSEIELPANPKRIDLIRACTMASELLDYVD